jgi:hypothetical protein
MSIILHPYILYYPIDLNLKYIKYLNYLIDIFVTI